MSEGRSFSAHEKKCFFLNTAIPGVKPDGIPRFADASSAAGFDFPDDGRSLGVVDWDFDGRLDFWTGNRNSPRLRFIRNTLAAGHHWLALRLRGDGKKTSRDAIGARAEIELGGAVPRRLIRTLRAGEGFLSQSAKTIHFGLGAETSVKALRIRWPGGVTEEFRGVKADGIFVLTQGSGKAERWTPPKKRAPIVPSSQPTPPTQDFARIVLAARHFLPALEASRFDGEAMPLGPTFARPVCITLWSPTCLACRDELAGLTRLAGDFEKAGVDLVGLEFPVEGTPTDPRERAAVAGKFWKDTAAPFRAGMMSEHSAAVLEAFQKSLSERIRPLGTPSALLIDAEGRVVAVYKGSVPAATLLADAALTRLPDNEIRDHAIAAPGAWFTEPAPPNPVRVGLALQDVGLHADAATYLQRFLASKYANVAGNATQLATIHMGLAVIHTSLGRTEDAIAAWKAATRADPGIRTPHLRLGNLLLQRHQFDEAGEYLAAALRMKKDDADALSQLALARLGRNRLNEAEQLCIAALEFQPGHLASRYNLAFALQRQSKDAPAAAQYRILLDASRNPIASNNLAWLLACTPDDRLRSGSEALRLIAPLIRDAGDTQPIFHATHAAALAENRQFVEASAAADKAIALLEKTMPNSGLIRSLKRQRDLYRQQKPCREALGS